MTAIVGLVHKGTVHVGGDSAGVDDGLTPTVRADAKVSVHSDYQVGEAVDGFTAVGFGQEIALGALYATARSRMAPQKRLKLALEAAERFSAGVRGPFAYVSKEAE